MILKEIKTTDSCAVVFLSNKENQVFLQLRAKDDDSYPGCWDFTAGGTIDKGEEPGDAAKRELEEEVGVNAELKLLGKELFMYPSGLREWMYIYQGLYEGEFVLDKKEVEKVQSFTHEEIREMVKKEENIFHPECVFVLKKYLLKFE